MKDNKKYIHIKGANEHNLKNIDIDIPRDEFTVVTGLAVQVSHPLLLTLFMQKDREDIWNHYLPMQDSS